VEFKVDEMETWESYKVIIVYKTGGEGEVLGFLAAV
jgi:hypothetical protein